MVANAVPMASETEAAGAAASNDAPDAPPEKPA
jgi:hypothetical protein